MKKPKPPSPAGLSPEHPRPQLQRPHWINLDGPWQFTLDPEAAHRGPETVRFDRTIRVPFAPETPASGVEHGDFFRACWYRREFDAPELAEGQRLILHFGAVDYSAQVWVNGRLAAEHEGGYTPFHADITAHLTPQGKQSIVVRAMDDPHDLSKPRGKQDWWLHPHSIWYMRTSGIWQTVWMEVLPATSIASVRWTADVERWQISLAARLDGQWRADGPTSGSGRGRGGLRLAVRLRHGDELLANDLYAIEGSEVRRTISLDDPGIDDARHRLLWTPDSPQIIEAELALLDADGTAIDHVFSYTAMRMVGTLGSRFTLNGSPYYLRLALDQGYWPQTGLTPPGTDALRRDIELARSMGFNGVRKHQKIEDPRFLYLADHMGLLVWEEMPSCYTFTPQSVQRLTHQWMEIIERDASHPCIVAWVPFNESWGVPDLPRIAGQRHWVQSIYHLTRTLDPTRPVSGNDGWENIATDILGIHDYEADPQRLAQRYAGDETHVAQLLHTQRPAGRRLVLEGFGSHEHPIMLTEFGGIAFSATRGSWGYSRAGSSGEFAARFGRLLSAIRSLPMLAGFCYTQFTDTYQEANGLLTMDRKPKFPLDQIACAIRGPRTDLEREMELRWLTESRQRTGRRSKR